MKQFKTCLPPQHINLAHSQTEINASKTFPEYLIRLSISQMEGNFSDLIFNLFKSEHENDVKSEKVWLRSQIELFLWIPPSIKTITTLMTISSEYFHIYNGIIILLKTIKESSVIKSTIMPLNYSVPFSWVRLVRSNLENFLFFLQTFTKFVMENRPLSFPLLSSS